MLQVSMGVSNKVVPGKSTAQVLRYFVHSQYFGFMNCGYCEYSQCFEVLYCCGYFRTLNISVFCTAGTANADSILSAIYYTASTRSTKILSTV